MYGEKNEDAFLKKIESLPLPKYKNWFPLAETKKIFIGLKYDGENQRLTVTWAERACLSNFFFFFVKK